MIYVHGLVIDALDATWVALGMALGVAATLGAQRLTRKSKYKLRG